MSTDTIISDTNTLLAKAEADLKEVESYRADAKENLKRAKEAHKSVETAAKAYAPRVVNGVKWLNQNARGWTTGLFQPIEGGFRIVNTPDSKQWTSLGLDTDPRIEKRTDVDGEHVLNALWQTALEIQKGKKSVTVPLLLRRVGLS